MRSRRDEFTSGRLGISLGLAGRVRRGVVLACALLLPISVRAANPDGALRVEVITAYNLIVDSNVESPSTYAPRSAYMGAQFYNDGTQALTDVWAYIGDYTNGTPGLYPSRAQAPYVGPLPGSEFALTHEGGAAGTTDATRYLGTIEPGESETVYWLISYPNLDENGDSVTGGVKPVDDLWLQFSVWGTALDGAAPLEADVTRTVTMRNEISAMANKIYPNGANKVPQEYQDLLALYEPSWTNTADDGSPGTTIATEGVWYDLGNVGAGFDNDGDLIPDRNAWLQPVGDAGLFDSSCFRLVHTYALVIVKLNDGTETIYNVEDQLYFENIPANNRGAVGYVRYEFMAMRSGCSSTLTPYQEVASGFDNEKFNGDYGAFLGQGLTTLEAHMAVTKSVDHPFIAPGETLSYTIAFTNSGPVSVGDPDAGAAMVMREHIPHGTLYVGLSSTSSNTLPAGVSSYTILYSTNNGAFWQSTEPADPTTVTDVQWWLSDTFGTNVAGDVKMQVTVQDPYTNSPLILNEGCATIAGAGELACDQTTTYVSGTNTLGDLVWADNGVGSGVLGNQVQDGAEPGISNVTVWLYYDDNTNGWYDAGDLFYGSNVTSASGAYLFTNLPDGKFVALVDASDSDLPYGYTPTTATNIAADLDSAHATTNRVQFLAADFGFAPALSLTKILTSANAFREGQLVTYDLVVSNSLPGDGAGGGAPLEVTVWATNGTAIAADWPGYTNAFIPPGPDGLYASNKFAGATKILELSNFPVGAQSATITNVSLTIPIDIVSGFGVDDDLQLIVSQLSPATEIFSSTYLAVDLVAGTWSIPMTGAFAWAWSDFGTNYNVQLIASKNAGGAGSGWILVDAVGFKIQTDETSAGSSGTSTLNPVPLTDQYDADLFEFVNAVPPVTSSLTNGIDPNSVGSLKWSNLGPIYPGGTSTAEVTFKLLEPPNNTDAVTTNITWVTNALFLSGTPANNATSSVVSTQLPAATLGDYIWRDLNADGIQNETNMGIALVEVTLTPPAAIDLGAGLGVAITTTTDESGFYLFESIPALGVYTVSVVTATLPGGSGVITFDEDGVLDSTTSVYLDPYANGTNNTHLTTDYGYELGTTIEGTIWHDWNQGGETNRQAGEDWLTNVTVYLCASPSPCGPGASIATNTTSTNGFFRFVGPYEGDYTVLVETNTGMMAGGNWTQSFDTDGTNTANYASVTVPTGSVARVDYSYYQTGPYEIGDTLFYDWDGNGVQSNAFEEGIPFITVNLYEDSNSNGVIDAGTDAFIASTTTATNGTYLFTNLFATNTYLVAVDLDDSQMPSSYFVTADPYGALDGRSVVTITNTSRLDQDFGFQPYGSGAIGDTVWKDMNSDGLQSGPQETGISNILVSLYVDFDGDGGYVLLQITNTSSSGTYLFDSLPDGDYRVLVDAADADLPQDAFGNVYFPTTATSFDVTISGGSTDLDSDFGFAPYGAIGDTLFWDANRNGTEDYSEEGIPGVDVELYLDLNANGVYDLGETLVANATTDADGKYLFSELPPDNYVVWVVTTNSPLLGVSQSADPESDGYACADTNLLVACDDQTGVTLSSGQNFMGADFGYIPPGVIGDTLWIDTNDDGVRDPEESGIPYVSVVLYSNGVAIATNETDGDGYYYFSDLLDATYSVQVDTNDTEFPVGLAQTYDPDGSLDNLATNIVISGGVVTSVGGSPCTDCDLSIDFGYRYVGSNNLSGTIGFDAQPYDGVLNGTNTSGVATNEVAYQNVQVYLYLWNDDGDGIVEPGEYTQISTTTTDGNGDYAFTSLPNGDGDDQYIVSSLAPEADLKITTTNGSIAGVTVAESVNAQGHTLSATLTIDIAPDITGMDFAYRSTKQYDYGDLPSSYQTLLPGGARHAVSILTNLYLGATVDTEINGFPSVGADGDNLDQTDDEDGVEPIDYWLDGSTGTVQVTVGEGDGWLVGYIDFNTNGVFTDVGDLIFSQAVSSTGGPATDGVYDLSTSIPSGSLNPTNTTELYARFRLFPSEPLIPELAFSGTADNGEVEDYLWELHAINGTVYGDTDFDSNFSGGDTPQAGVIVRLYDAATNLLAETVTDLTGAYHFSSMPDGDYQIDMTTPTGSTAILDVDGPANGDDHIDLTLAGASAFVQDFLLDTGASVADLSGTVYEDDGYAVPGNGSFDTNDVAISNVTITLYRDINSDGVADANEEIASTVTDTTGDYLFSNLPDGDYIIVETPPSGSTAITDIDGVGNGADLIEATLAGIDVTGQDYLVDGATTTVSLSGLVWRDDSLEGIRDAGETNRFAGIPVDLLDADSNVVATTTTAADGTYLFTNLTTATYLVRFDLTGISSNTYTVTGALQGTNDTVNSDVITGETGEYGWTGPITLSAGTDVENIDLGLKPAVAIDVGVGKTVDDALLYEGDPVVFTISVTNFSDTTDATALELTDVLPSGFTYSNDVPSLGTFDSTTGVWTVGTLVTGAVATLDVTLVADVGSGGYWWTNTVAISALQQTDTNPANDTAEAEVLVVGADLALTKTVDNPTPGEGVPVTYTIVVSNIGPSDTTGVLVSEPLTNGMTYVSNNVTQGSYASGSGIWTVGALNVGQSESLWITVDLATNILGEAVTNVSRITATDIPDPNPSNDVDAAVVAVTTPSVLKTSDVGGYTAPGNTITYTIVVSNQSAAILTGLDVTDAVPTGTTYVAASLTAVLTPLAPSIPTSVVYDTTTTFVVPAGVTGLVVEAWGAGGGGGKATTDNNNSGGGGGGGGYGRSVISVTPGTTQTVTVGTGGIAGSVGADSWFGAIGTVFGAGGGGGGSDVTVGAGGTANVGTVVTYDGGTGGAGMTTGSRTGGGGGGSPTASADGNNGSDGVIGGAGGTGTGTGGDGTVGAVAGNPGGAPGAGGGGGGATAIGGAGADGRIIVNYTIPGNDGTTGDPPTLAMDYILDPHAILTLTYQVTVNNPLEVTEVCNTVYVTSDQMPFPISDSMCDPVDPAYLSAIGDYTWVDSNANGQQDGGEPALSNVVVSLYDASSNLVDSTSTSGSGAYDFSNLLPGSYFVSFLPPAGYLFTTSNVGADATDSDPLPGTNRTANVTLTVGATNNTVDAGFYLPAAIGDFTWVDSNGNGQQDGGEPGLSNVVVGLYNAASNVVGVKTSSATGAYSFTNLPPGDYFVSFAPPSGYLFTTSNVGSDATDSDPLTGTNRTAVITLTSGETDLTVDAGFYLPATVGNLVWVDANRDGIQDASETNGVPNLPVALLDADSNVVASTTTDVTGLYIFSNMPPGTYSVRFDLATVATNVEVSPFQQGGDDALDSDVTTGATGEYASTDPLALSSGEVNLNIDLGLRPEAATRAELAEVWGEWADGEGRVGWRTSSEWGTAGFFVYRVDLETGEEVRLSDRLLPAAFHEAGAVYELVDPMAREGDNGLVRLEEVELSGATLDLGTHPVTFAEAPVVAKAARAESRAARSAVPTLRVVSRTMRPTGALKVLLKKEGAYAVGLQSIANGMGRSLEEIQDLAAQGRLAFRSEGNLIPVLYDEARQQLIFYGEATKNWYTRDAAVMISQEDGLAMTRRDPGATGGESVFPVDLRFEQDRYPFDSAITRPEDFYYWEYVISGHPTLGVRNFAMDWTGYAGGDADLTIRLMGWSSTDNDPDHLAEFSFNGHAAGSIAFDGQEEIEASLTIPAAWIINGENSLSVKGALQDGYTHSYFVVDRVDASFERELTPFEGTAIFRAGEASSVSAQAFNEPLVLALNESGSPTWIAEEDGRLPSKAWTVETENERFAVVEADAVSPLDVQPAAVDAWFLSPDNRIDYLVITSRDLASAAQELADYRNDQGLRVGVAVFEDICDLMTDGLRTPEAIPALLAYAQAIWAEAPWMVVLAGNGHYDYLSALNNEANHLPPMLLQTHDGIFAADGLLADAKGDGLPDVAIGRLPALDSAGLTEMIQKIKEYEADFGADWQNDLVLAADKTDSAAGCFSAANDDLSALAAAPYAVSKRIDLDTTPISTARSSLLDQFQTGAGFIHYTGHGGLMNLSAQGLLKSADVSAMKNARQPVVVALSCLVGRFEAPAVDSLGERLMRQTDGGAVAVWGPSGLSRNAPATELGEAFYRGILQEGIGTLGSAVLRARCSLQSDEFSRDTLSIYNLLGDPALRIAGNTEDIPSDESFAQWRWQHFTPEELADAAVSADTTANFYHYAMSGGDPVKAELAEWGYSGLGSRLSAGDGFILRWKRRINRSDIDYHLVVSDDLAEWEATPSDLQTIGVEADPDGVMETVRTWIDRPASKRIFIGIKATRK
jgi:uncharacterized repeat protein (TIGR01451 family)